jgi:methylated-DNA-[protein]-cysteine S-methyltransferase
MPLYYGLYKSPIGVLGVVANDTDIKTLTFQATAGGPKKKFNGPLLQENSPLIKRAFKQLDEYFAGRRKSFDLPLDPEGTEFQKKAWKALLTIPYGETISYQEQALRAGNKKAVRAIGGANNKNPIALIIPCHRVIGKNGDLVGFGGGLDTKVTLLKLEGRL